MRTQPNTNRQSTLRRARSGRTAPSSDGKDITKPTRTDTYTHTRKRRRKLLAEANNGLIDLRF